MESIALTKNGLIIRTGEKVRIKDLDELKKCMDVVEGMYRKAGQWVTVDEIRADLHCGNKAFTIKEDELFYIWDETMISASSSSLHEINLSAPVSKASEQKIVIWSDGKMSKAKLYENGRNVASVITTRSDADKHDLRVAVDVLMARLKAGTPGRVYWGETEPEKKPAMQTVRCKMIESEGTHSAGLLFLFDERYELREDELRTVVVDWAGIAHVAKKWNGLFPHYTVKRDGYIYTFEKE